MQIEVPKRRVTIAVLLLVCAIVGFLISAAVSPTPSRVSAFAASLSGSAPRELPAADAMAAPHEPLQPIMPRAVQLAPKPRVYYVHNVITPEEAAEIIRLATPVLERSRTVGTKENPGVISEVRTSNGMFMISPEQMAFANTIATRVSVLTGIPVRNFEHMQVLRYRAGQYYRSHPDYFSGSFAQEQMGRGGNRQATIVMFLNTCKSGGHTAFPRMNVAVPPKQGDGVLFWSKNTAGDYDEGAWHEAVPPGPGESKWVAIYWMRESQHRPS